MEQESENQTLLGTKVDLASRKGIKPAYFEFVKKDLIYAAAGQYDQCVDFLRQYDVIFGLPRRNLQDSA